MKVLICGAGIAGLTLANCLATHDGEVVVVERSPGPRSQGYMIDFFGPGYDAAAAMAYGGLGWVVPEALDRCPPSEEIYYDQVAQIEMPSWSRGPVVLVGDACYAVSLIAGQGASLAIAGAYVLAEQLTSTQSVEDALEKYEKLWRPVTEEKQKVGRSGARWFLPSSAWQLRVRRAVLRVARLPVVDRYVAVALAGKPTTVVTSLARSGGGHGSNSGRFMRAIFRAPVGLYDRNLGWLLGSCFACLTHVGRRSGRRYRTVLEVIGMRPATGEILVVAGMGPSSDWYRNIQANASAEIVVGRRRFTAEHRVLDEPEAVAVVADYERRNSLVLPIIRRVLSWLLGWRYGGTATARHRLVRQLPVVGFRPRTE